MPAIIRIGDPVSCGDVMANGSGNVFANGIPVSREGTDNTAGHCFNPTPVSSASPDVFTNNIKTDRVGDPIVRHYCPGKPPHNGTMVNGSPNVFVNDPGAGSSLSNEQAAQIVATYSGSKQEGVSAYDHATVESDDEGAPSDTGGHAPVSTGTVNHTQKQVYVAAAAQTENVDMTPSTTSETAVTKQPQVTTSSNYNYDDIEAASSFSASFQLSPNFTLGQLTTGARVSHYALKAQTTNGREYSAKDIVKNLRDLCYNILEPFKAMYPSAVVNSGFRHTSNGKSQHERGQAADMAVPSVDHDANNAWTIAQAVANSSIPFDQFIFEQNNSIWFHFSYDKSRGKQRGMVMSKPRGQTNPTVGLQKAL